MAAFRGVIYIYPKISWYDIAFYSLFSTRYSTSFSISRLTDWKNSRDAIAISSINSRAAFTAAGVRRVASGKQYSRNLRRSAHNMSDVIGTSINADTYALGHLSRASPLIINPFLSHNHTWPPRHTTPDYRTSSASFLNSGTDLRTYCWEQQTTRRKSICGVLAASSTKWGPDTRCFRAPLSRTNWTWYSKCWVHRRTTNGRICP